MTDIAAAQERLQRALIRLEAAQSALIDRPAPEPESNAPASGGPETAELVNSLEAVQRENTELTALAEAIGARLDKTIERIDTLVESTSAASSEKAAS